MNLRRLCYTFKAAELEITETKISLFLCLIPVSKLLTTSHAEYQTHTTCSEADLAKRILPALHVECGGQTPYPLAGEQWGSRCGCVPVVLECTLTGSLELTICTSSQLGIHCLICSLKSGIWEHLHCSNQQALQVRDDVFLERQCPHHH